MKNKDKKMLLFVVATIVTSLGIGYTLLKGTSATDTLSEVPANPAFDDINFYKCVVDYYNKENSPDVGYDVSLSDEQLKKIKNLSCMYSNISSLNGVEKLSSLKTLDVRSNKLTELDVSKNIALTSLNVVWNELTELDVSQNKELTKLDVGGNNITKLDVGHALITLNAAANDLTELDLSNNTMLTTLDVASNKLTKLDLSKNTELITVDVGNNKITSLSTGSALITLDAAHNKLTNLDISRSASLNSLDVSYNELTQLDISKNVALTTLNAERNNLIRLDASKNALLTDLNVSVNSLTTLSVGSALTSLNADTNNLTALDVSNSIKITYLNINSNKLTQLNVSQNKELTNLTIAFNKLKELDVSQNTSLISLNVQGSCLTNLDIAKNTVLESLNVEGNKLMTLNVAQNLSLTSLNIRNNELTQLNVSKNTELITLNLYGNNLTELELGKNVSLVFLDVALNQLKELDVSQNTALTSLCTEMNQLTELDVSKNTNLVHFNARYNKLKELDVSKNTLLKTLYVDCNQLSGLDASQNTALTHLRIGYNSFNEKIYVYRGQNVVVGTNVKIPEQLGWDVSTWSGYNTSIATVDKNGIVTTLNSGSVDLYGTLKVEDGITTTITSIVNVVNISSSKYKINEEDNYIYVGSDNEMDTIKNNIDVSDANITIDINNNKLYVKYGEQILKEFLIVSVSSDYYNLSKDYIYIETGVFDKTKVNVVNGISKLENDKLLIKYDDVLLDEYKIVGFNINNYHVVGNLLVLSFDTPYEEFIENIVVMDDVVTYKIYNGDLEIVDGDVSEYMELVIYCDENEMSRYVITGDYVYFDEILQVDENSKVISGLNTGNIINDMLDKVDTNGSIDVLDRNDNLLNGVNSILKTGNKFRVNLPSQTLVYSISVMGDVNGDGTITREDIELSAKHIIHGNLIIGAEYLKATDMDNNNVTNINDIIKIVRKVKGV